MIERTIMAPTSTLLVERATFQAATIHPEGHDPERIMLVTVSAMDMNDDEADDNVLMEFVLDQESANLIHTNFTDALKYLNNPLG